MSTLPLAIPAAEMPWTLPSRGRVGMFALIAAELAIFTIFVVAYIFYVGKSLSGPTPQQVLRIPIFNTICLLSSSLTIHLAVGALGEGKNARFKFFWFLTFVLGAVFLIGTGREWYHLIYEEGLTISTNLFGTTYYSLVGLHAFHVTAGLIMLSIVLFFGLAGRVRPEQSARVDVLASTAWPLVLAFGFTLMFAGLLTSASVSVLGVVLAVAGCVGWFREVFPHEHEEAVPIVFEDHRITTERRVVERVPVAPDLVRAWLPLETYPISAGLKGGLAGGVAMAVLACTYGLLKAGSIWYPINLLAATVYAESLKLGNSQLNSFHADSFAIALVLHGIGSIFVGLLYGAMLPMFARRPIVLGGLITPVLWSGLLYSIMQLLNPLLASRIDWIWFMASQIAFGAVAGIVVVRQERISTRENLPFLVRAGIEAPGVIPPRESGEKRP